MSNMGTSSSYRRAEGETTEWEDILIAKGIIAPKKDPNEDARKAAFEEEVERVAAAVDPLAKKTLDELDELEQDDDDLADSRIIESYRQARLEQIKAAAARNKFGMLFPLSRPDFVREVTEASKEVPVVVFLYKDGIDDSRLLEAVLLRLVTKHKATKFMKIPSESCIENYPDRNVPTLFYYRHGEVKASLVGLATMGGAKVSDKTVEWALSRHGAVETELDEDPLKAGASSSSGGAAGRVVSSYATSSARGRRYDSDDDEDDR